MHERETPGSVPLELAERIQKKGVTGLRSLVQVENHFMPPSALRFGPREVAA